MTCTVRNTTVVIVAILVLLTGFLPQMASAHVYDARVSQYTSNLSTQPASVLKPTPSSNTEAYYYSTRSNLENDNGNTTIPQTIMTSSQTSKVIANTNTIAPALSRDISNPGINVDELIAAAPEFPGAALVLTTAKKTWDTHPLSHEEMVQCVENESFSDPDWFGVSPVDEVNHVENIHGTDENYVSRYEAFFYVSNPGTWSFATDSKGASEIEIDGQVVVGWYGEHPQAGNWSNNGVVTLDSGWHSFTYRHEAGSGGMPIARAGFQAPRHETWRLVSTSNLTLKPVNLDDGVLLTTKKNNSVSLPVNSAELLQCIETDATQEAGWYGSSIVDEINQEGNIHGNNVSYTSLYECFFLSEIPGTWTFETVAFGASEIEIDGQIVTSHYGTDSVTSIGTVDLDEGWHRFILRHVNDGGNEPVTASFKDPDDPETRPFSIDELTIKGTCYLGVDGDSLPAFAEAVLGTHPALSDTDCDTIDDYYEIKNGLDPLETDSNRDGLNDLVETNGVEPDLDGDGIPNAWDADNDNDGVPDRVDISPFSKSAVYDQFEFDIITEGNPLYIDFQIRPKDSDHLTLPLRNWDWPDDDRHGQIRGVLDSTEDIQIFPTLEMDVNYLPEGAELSRYGIAVVDDRIQVPLVPLEDKGITVAFQGRLFYPQTANPLNLSGKLVWNVISTSPDYYRIVDNEGNCLTFSSPIGFVPQLLGLDYASTPHFPFDTFILQPWQDKDSQKWQLRQDPTRLLITNELNGCTLVVDDPTQWQIELVEENNSQPIVWYPEDFMLTGISAEESYANTAEVGLSYTTEYEQTIAAAAVLQREFLYSQNSITEAKDTFPGYGLDPFTTVIESYLHFDRVLAAEADLTDQALQSMGDAEPELPILWAFQNTSAQKVMGELVSDSYILEDSYFIDLTEVPERTRKTVRLTWYDTQTGESLGSQELLGMLSSWGWTDEAIPSTSLVLLTWSNGQNVITSIGGEAIDFDVTAAQDSDVMEIISKVTTGYGLTYVDVLLGILGIAKEIGVKLAKESTKFEILGKFLTALGPIITIIGFGIDGVFAIINAVTMLEQFGGGEFGAAVALSTGIAAISASGAFALLHIIAWGIGLIPGWGWIVGGIMEAILWTIQLSDWIVSLIFGNGWMGMIWDAILKSCTDVNALGTIEDIQMDIGQPNIQDPDGNGLDPYDSIVLENSFTWKLVPLNNTDFVRRNLDYFAKMSIVRNDSLFHVSEETVSQGEGFHNQRVTIVPQKSMLNMPMEAFLYYHYEIPYRKCFNLFWVIPICENATWTEYEFTTPTKLYFDVLPSSVSEFLRWREITALDKDGDGLPDTEETSIGTNPNLRDTDADGVPDRFESENGMNPTNEDSDADGLLDGIELQLGTDPLHTDTDRDGLSDFDEYTGWLIGFEYGGQLFIERVWGDPLFPDGDLDGLTDSEEFGKYNPHSADSDGDGILDPDDSPLNIVDLLSEDTDGDGLTGQQEIDGWGSRIICDGSSVTEHVNSNMMLADTDFDGLDDGQESSIATNPRKPDTDADGLGDLVETELGTNPTNCDTDADSLDDGTEIAFGSDPLLPDTDSDGLTDFEEFELGSDPLSADTDGDGLLDSEELAFGSSLLRPDPDEDGLLDLQEFQMNTDPWHPDSDGDILTDGYEVTIGTDPTNADTDGDNLTDGEEVELWIDPLNPDTDGDNLTDGQEVKDYATNPSYEDTDDDGTTDDLDEDTFTPHVSQVTVVYDEYTPRVAQFIDSLSQYTQVDPGTWDTHWEALMQDGNIIMIGHPSSPGPVWEEMEFLITDVYDDPDLLDRMEESDLYRFATITDQVLATAPPDPMIIPPMSDDQAIVMLTKPYPADHWRTLAMLKNLKVEVLDNSVSVIYSESKEYFTIDAVNCIDFSVHAELTERVNAMGAKISRYNENTTPHYLTYETGLATGEVPIGKYMDIWVSENVQNLSSGVDLIDQATLKLYYTDLELDGTPGKDGNSKGPGDIDEETLCLYRWAEDQGNWIKLSNNLDWVNSIGVDTDDVKPMDTQYEGYVWADVGHLSLYALAGQIRPVEIESTSPSSGEVGVPRNTKVKVKYNGDVITSDLSGILVNNDTAGVTANLNESSDTLTIDYGNFAANTTYTVTIPSGAIKDLFGNPIEEYVWSFTTKVIPTPTPIPPPIIIPAPLPKPVVPSPTTPHPSPTAKPTPMPVASPTPPPPAIPVSKPTPTTEPEGVVTLEGKVNLEGVILEGITVISSNGGATVVIPVDTVAVDTVGKPLREIAIQPADSVVPEPPQDASIITVLNFGPDGATFNPSITISINYDPDALPEGTSEETLILAFYDTSIGEWVELQDITVDMVNHAVKGITSHFTLFAILSKVVEEPVMEPTPTSEPLPTPEENDGSPVNIPLISGLMVVAIIAIATLIFFILRGRRITRTGATL